MKISPPNSSAVMLRPTSSTPPRGIIRIVSGAGGGMGVTPRRGRVSRLCSTRERPRRGGCVGRPKCRRGGLDRRGPGRGEEWRSGSFVGVTARVDAELDGSGEFVIIDYERINRN